MYKTVLVCLCLFAVVSVQGAETPKAPQQLSDVVTLPARPRALSKVFFMGSDDPVLCINVEIDKKENTITYASIANKVRITKSLNRLHKVEPAIGPIELMAKRGEQLLAAHAFPALRDDAQREIIKFLKWGTGKEMVMWGKDEVDAPWEEAVELAVSAIAQYPVNEKIADITLGLLLKFGDERLEMTLLATLKKNSQWDAGFNAMAELLDAQSREQELYAFVKKWAKTHSGNPVSNKWLMQQALKNGDMKLARDASRRLWSRKKDPQAGAELAKIYLMSNKGEDALKIANMVLQIENVPVELAEEMKVIAGSALLAQGKLEEAGAMLEEAQNSSSEKLQAIAAHNLGVLYWMRGDRAAASAQWETLTHPASQLARAIANRRSTSGEAILNHPALAQTANELNVCLALESEDGERAMRLLKTVNSERQVFLKRVCELLQGEYNASAIQSLNYFQSTESKLWRAYAYIQLGEFAKAETVISDVPADHGYAAVYRVYCAEGLKEPQRAAELFAIALKSENPPRHYLSEMESHYLTLKSSREREDFKWHAGDVLRTGWFSEAQKTGIHVFAQGEYLAFKGQQASEGLSRAWRKRSKERLRKIKASFDPARGWSGIELLDELGENGLAVAIEYVDDAQVVVWRRLAEGAWTMWNELGPAPAQENSLTLMIDDSLLGNEQIQLLNERGELTSLGSLEDIPGSHMRVGFFTLATSGTDVDMKVTELVFEVRPKEDQ